MRKILILTAFIINANAFSNDSIIDVISCSDYKSKSYDLFYDLLRDGATQKQVDQFIEKQLSFPASVLKSKNANIESFKLEIRNFLNTIFFSHLELVGAYDSYELFKKIIGSELGDNTSNQRSVFNNSVDLSFRFLHDKALKNKIECNSLVEPVSDPSTSLTAEQGSRRFFKIFYQTCDALDFDPVDEQTPDLEGVKIIGQHPAGGNKRVIGDLSKVLRTHFHLKQGGDYGSSCFNWKVKPPIYDFGGKPYANSTSFNLFRNSGSGTSVLGIDCSAVIVSSLGAAGRRLKKGVRFKPEFIHNVSSSMLRAPESNGLSCLKKVKVTPESYQLKAGDIIAKRGHVTIVSSVEADPWGLAAITQLDQCLIDNMSTRKFNFTLVQSAPIKGGIGVTRINAKDYYEDEGSQGKVLRKHALNSCYAKFSSSRRVSTSDVSVVRHLDDPACLQAPVDFVNQECVESCL